MLDSDAEPSVISKGVYTYVHDVSKGSPEEIDVHHIVISRSHGRNLMFSVFAFFFGFVCYVTLFHLQVSPAFSCLGSVIVAVIVFKKLFRKQVEKESVIILPGFGIQLEASYMSGRIIRQFVPIGKVLKPVVNECVTPVTCYWSLCLILRGEEELLQVFKESYPPLTMLVPIWKALCAFTVDNEERNTCNQRIDNI